MTGIILIVICAMLWVADTCWVRSQAYRAREQQQAKEIMERFKTFIPDNKGWAVYAPIVGVVVILVVFIGGFTVGRHWPVDPQRTVYGLKVQRIVDSNSLEFEPAEIRSLELGRFRGDFCPELNISKYEPKIGYVMCRLRYTDKGCIAKVRDDDGFTWVKDQDGKTVVLKANDTFKPWPVCVKENIVAQGGH